MEVCEEYMDVQEETVQSFVMTFPYSTSPQSSPPSKHLARHLASLPLHVFLTGWIW